MSALPATAAARAAAANSMRASRRAARWFAWFVVGLVAMGPVLVNDVPLCASVGGTWSFPAFLDLVGATPAPGPDDLSWKQWWTRIPEGSPDWALFPPWPYGPTEANVELMRGGPTVAHPFGNDDTGRDVLARILRGARVTVGASLLGVALGGLLGVLLGALAGLRRGVLDILVQRLIEVFQCFPGVLLLMVVAAFFGSSFLALVVAIGLVMWPSFARIVRGELLSLREREFVVVARDLGIPPGRIVTHHLLPQLRGQIAVTFAFGLAGAIVAESTLAFLGIGPGVQGGSWGSILEQGKANAHLGTWHLWFFPGAWIVLCVVCCHALADGMRRR